MKNRVGWGVLVLLVGLGCGLAAGFTLGMNRPMESDARHFLVLAQSLAAGEGYRCSETYWPATPSMQRMPGWPFVVSLGLRLAPSLPADRIMRWLNLSLNAGVALLIFVLTWILFQRVGVAVLAGLAYALHPVGIYLAYTGLSEVLFLFLGLGGVILILQEGWRRAAGFLLLGCACLERSNFVLWLGFFVLFAWWHMRRTKTGAPGYGRVAPAIPNWLAWPLYAAFFLLPPLAWMARNHDVSGHFPVISTFRGQNFYGGNNPVAADTLEFWGYCVFPDAIPGETREAVLAQTMSEYQVDVYYFDKGWSYIREHWSSMPRLWVGKLVRAYVPWPWKPRWDTCLAGAVRLVIFVGAIMGLIGGWRMTPPVFRIGLLAMVATNVLTVLLFWGYARFAFALEPFFLPFFAVGVAALNAKMRTYWRAPA